MKRTLFQPPTWLWVLLLFALAGVLRTFALARYVTPDEPNWVYRTLNFGAALARGDWAGTVQAGHPGVTTMWLGTLGIDLQRWVDPTRAGEAIDWLSKLDRLSAENVAAFKRIGVLLDWARLPVIAVNALGVAGVFLLMRRLLGQRVALLAAVLLALDPFVAGLGGLLHVDGLLATFSTLSVLALLNGIARMADGGWQTAEHGFVIRNSHSTIGWFALSGAFAGLATLSKSPALFLFPFALIVVAGALVSKRLAIRDTLIGLLVFFVVSGSLFIALYPAMWSDPATAIDVMFERASHHALDATRATFFDGQAELNHGLGFYPVALAYRVSPVIVIGLVLAAFHLLNQARRPGRDGSHFAVLALIVFAITFTLFLSLAAKKFDRYLLPVLPPLIGVAAWAIQQSTGRWAQALPASALVFQALFVLSVVPYPLMAYDPLAGGAAGARDRIAVGWGEGFGAGAAWVADHDPGAVIASGGLANVAPVYRGQTVTIDAAGLAGADYLLFTLSEVQLYPEFFNGLAQHGRLAQAISIGGVDAAWVYATTRATAQADWLRRAVQPGDAIVLDAATPLARQLAALPVSLLPPDATPELISTTLVELRARSRIVYVSTDAASGVVRGQVRAWLDRNAQLADQAEVDGAAVRIYTPNRADPAPPDPFAVQFDGAVALLGLEPVTDPVAYPDRITVAARWQVVGRPTTGYSATLELTDAYGDTWAQFGGPLRDASDLMPKDWSTGEIADQIFSVQVPPALAPGVYRLRFSIDRPDGQRAGLASASGAFSGTAPLLATVNVSPARPTFEPDVSDPRQRIEHTWPGVVELLGLDLLTYVPATGDQFLATLHWRSLREGLDPATELRWRLEPDFAAPAGEHRFEWQTPLAPNSPGPLFNGDVLSSRYSVRLPLDLPDGRYRLLLAVGGGDAFDVAPIDVTHHARTFELTQRAVRAGALGTFDVFFDEPTKHIRPGESLPVTLALQAGDEVNVNYTLFVHLVDSSGRVVAQVDAWPQGGLWPTANLVLGQVVEDTLTLTPAADVAPGTYQLVVGLYDALDGSRLTAWDAQGQVALENRLVLGEIEIGD